MANNQRLTNASYVGSEKSSNSSDDELTRPSASRKAEAEAMDLMVISAFKRVIVPTMENLVRRVVRELLEERILTKINKNSTDGMQNSEAKSLKLQFVGKLSLPVWTGKNIKGEDSNSLKIALVDAGTGEEVKFGPEASAKVELVVLQADPDDGEGQHWTSEEFNRKIVRDKKRGKSILKGDTSLNLKEGIGSFGEIRFVHGKKWMARRHLMLGAKIVGNFEGISVREAKSEPFILTDGRNTLYGKRDIPSLSDEVWRLRNLYKRGPLVKRLSENNIKCVKDLLTWNFTNNQGLRDILGNGIPDTKLKETVEHALTCKLDDRYIYHLPSFQPKSGIVFNVVGQIVGVVSECRYVPVSELSDKTKADAQNLIASQFEHFRELVPYDENSFWGNSFRSEDALSPSKWPRPESLSGLNVCIDMHPEFDHVQPITSFPGNISSNESSKRTNSMEILGSLSIYDMEILGSPSHAPDTNYVDLIMSISRDFEQDEQAWFANPSAVSHADQHNTLDVASDKAQSRRWLKISIVLRFMLRKKVVDADHVRKRHRPL